MDISVSAAPGDSRGRIAWNSHFAVCALGHGGIRTDKREGDGATPVGTFPLRRLLYRPDRLTCPPTGLAAIPIAPGDGWCDDPSHPLYNRPVQLPFMAGHEKLWRDDRLYDLAIVIGHNDEPVIPGHGSAVFVHLAKPDFTPTEGCVALSPTDMVVLLADCGKEDCLRISLV